MVHTVTRHCKTTKNIRVDYDRPDKNERNKYQQTDCVFGAWVASKKACFHLLYYTLIVVKKYLKHRHYPFIFHLKSAIVGK